MKSPSHGSRHLSVCVRLLIAYALLITSLAPLGTRAASGASAPNTQAADPPSSRDGEVLVRFRAGASEQDKERVARGRGADRKKLRGESGVEKLSVPAGRSAEGLALELMQEPAVEFAEPNFLITKDEVIPGDPQFGEQWALRNRSQNGGQFGSDIGVTEAWHKTTGSASTVIAVIDSGVNFSHPDLANNRWTNPSPGPAGDFHGWDYVTDTGVVKDEQGHGTAVAGVIAAQGDNAAGISGVMWSAGLMSLRVLDNTGTGDIARAVEAIDYAAAHGAQVINLSWGTAGESAALRQAIERAIRRGAVVVCSAGNGGRDVDAAPYYPASFGLRGLISVAATDNFDQLAPWSNWGARNVTVAAPGTDILTTKMGGGYWNVSGTSAAAPLVAGVAGLVKSARPSMSAHNVARAIGGRARQVGLLYGKVSSGGVVNAPGALDALTGSANQPPVVGGGAGHGNPFSDTPPPQTSGAPGSDLPDLDRVRNAEEDQPRAKAPVESNLPCLDCEPSGGGGGGYYPADDPDFSTARLLPRNETGQPGVYPGSRNFNWSLPLVNLKGRAGLDLDLALSYNSLVWTKDGSYIKYNGDLGAPAPGFKVGLPILQQRFRDAQTGTYAHLMVTPSGGRLEMRQIGTSNIYESQDGSYTQLDATNPSALLVRTSDGTQLTFVPTNNVAGLGYRCTQIKDRNGNYLSAAYDAYGHLTSVTDTLGRVVSFVYDASNNLSAIQQTWAGVARNWATFNYGQVYVAPNFSGLTVNGPNNAYVTVLTQVSLHDGSYYTFNYNAAFGQVNRINHYAADGHLRAYTSYNVNSAAGQTDCPRFTERRDWAENWNNGAEAVTGYSVAADNSWSQQTSPDGTISKEFYATSGWQAGLTTSTEAWSGGVRRKWTTISWTQDDTGVSYLKNPRVTETNVYDEAGNRKRTTINYGPYAAYSLPYEMIEYAADGVTMLRRTYTDYNLAAHYVNRRIIGLVSSVHVVDHATGGYVSKTSFDYDYGGEFMAATAQPATRHDAANYGAAFITGRGNLATIWRWDVTDINNTAKAVAQQRAAYNATGSLVFARDGLGHQTTVSYADSFSDGVARNTFAYPTAVTDADGFVSGAQYNFDFGAVTRTQDPKGAVQTLTYDSAARHTRTTNQFNASYTRVVYPTSQNLVQTYTTIVSGAGEAYSVTVLDGAGRVRAEGGDLPNSAGGYRGRFIYYDAMGRVSQQTNPAEMSSGWAPAGDDAAGWVWTYQTYDWQGRPRVTTNPDGSTRESIYGGCGCAGGQVTTARDERGRRRRMTADVFGRLMRVEELNLNQTVYSTTNYTYNVRDQITNINQAGQVRTFNYDGYGRQSSKTTPEQGTTSYAYFADGTMQKVTDARGATQTYSYNNRHLVTGIAFGAPAGVAATPNTSFAYDAAGNRTSMTDGSGSVSYAYNTVSQLTSETRTFTGVGTYTLTYAYNLGGELTSVTNPWSAQVGYAYDKTGRPTGVTGAGYMGVASYVSGITYRAFGTKQMSYANGRTLSLQYNNRMRVTNWNVAGVMGWNYSYNHFGENTGRVTYAQNLNDATLDRSYEYDHVGRLTIARSGVDARAHTGQAATGGAGPYSQQNNYDQFGNITSRTGWGGENPNFSATYTNNRRSGSQYDLAGNVTNDGGQSFTYDATGQQATAGYSGYASQHSYDGDRLRVKKVENGVVSYYLRSSLLGGQVVAELNYLGGWMRGYVYLGGDLLAVQQNGVYWMHQDPVAKSKRVTDASGGVVSTVELDPWGGYTNRSSNDAFQPRRFNAYERDGNGSDEAMHRRYNRWWARFDQPDPYEGSYAPSDPQSFNRYAYAQNDPVNFTDPSGLMMCGAEFSYSECGGGGGFWGGGGGFGGHVAVYNREYGGMPGNIASGLGAHNERLRDTLDALRANDAYQRAMKSGSAKDMARFLQLYDPERMTLLAVLSETQQAALILIELFFGQEIGDQVRFNVVAQLTGLSDYIEGTPEYNAADRTFSIRFKPGVEKFLDSSPYFYGPGPALLHRDVGNWDYRSDADYTGGLSLQVVPGRNLSRSYADFDRVNPYRDVVSFFGHNIPIIGRRIGRLFGR